MNGTVLERASHDYAVEVIKTASNPVEFVVQSLVEDSLENSDTGITILLITVVCSFAMSYSVGLLHNQIKDIYMIISTIRPRRFFQ